MYKKGELVVLYHNAERKHFIGSIELVYRRQKIRRYDVKTDRGLMEFLSEDPSNLIYIKSSTAKLKPM